MALIVAQPYKSMHVKYNTITPLMFIVITLSVHLVCIPVWMNDPERVNCMIYMYTNKFFVYVNIDVVRGLLMKINQHEKIV